MLSDDGLLGKERGKAVKVTSDDGFKRLDDLRLAARSTLHPELKRSVASKAVDELLAHADPNRPTIIAGGSTLATLAGLLPSLPSIEFMTTSLEVGAILARKANQEVQVLGGPIRSDTLSISSLDDPDALSEINASVCFLSANKLTERGLFVTTEDEAKLQRQLRAASERCVVLMDRSKLSKTTGSEYRALELDEIDLVITDAAVESDELQAKVAIEVARPRMVIGVDVGSRGIRAAVIDTYSGEHAGPLVHSPIENMSAAEPAEIIRAVSAAVAGLSLPGPVGISLPGQLDKNNREIVRAASYLPKWHGTEPVELFEAVLDRQVFVLNDADAAGLCEARFGSVRNLKERGLLLLLRRGGVGSAIIDKSEVEPASEVPRELRKGAGEDKSVAGIALTTGDEEEWLDRISLLCRDALDPARVKQTGGPFTFLVLSGGHATRRVEVSVAKAISHLEDVQLSRSRFGVQAVETGAAYHASTKAAEAPRTND